MRKHYFISILLLIFILNFPCFSANAENLPSRIICIPNEDIAIQFANLAINVIYSKVNLNDYDVKVFLLEQTEEWGIGYILKQSKQWLKDNDPQSDVRNIYIDAGYEMYYSLHNIIVIIKMHDAEITYIGPG